MNTHEQSSGRFASSRTARAVILGLTGVLLAVGAVSCKRRTDTGKPANVDYYTCSMHPSVKAQNPKDKCPICSMDLVAVERKGAAGGHDHSKMQAEHSAGAAGHDHAKMLAEQAAGKEGAPPAPTEFVVPVQRMQEIGVTFATVKAQPLPLSLRTVGVVAYDKLRHWDIVTRVEGYVDKLFVASKGELVEKGQPLVTIYSPDLLTTQREFLELLRARDKARESGAGALASFDALLDASKVRLRLWNITDPQIAELERTRQPQVHLTLQAPARGLVQDIQVDQGRKVMSGDHLVDVTDLSLVWVWAEFYQEELHLLEPGLPVTVTTSACPGETFTGRIAVIDPFINEAKRVARVRIDVENPDLKLRPDMYVDVELARDMGEGLTVPFSAVMPTGRRNVVFVSKGEGRLEPRFVDLGRKYGDFYEVRGGLKADESVVTSANFLIDAEAKVQGALKSW